MAQEFEPLGGILYTSSGFVFSITRDRKRAWSVYLWPESRRRIDLSAHVVDATVSEETAQRLWGDQADMMEVYHWLRANPVEKRDPPSHGSCCSGVTPGEGTA